MSSRFIALDWGTSSFRAYLMEADGRIAGERSGPDGILTVVDGDFDTVLERHIGAWDPAIPVLASGMITSKQGWIEVPYCTCPASLSEIAGALKRHVTKHGRTIAFVPGLSCDNDGIPDVMRGEETQVFGALEGEQGRFVLPGTHSKWVTVEKGRITRFTTYMTGEVFAALRNHTILGRLMREGDHDREAFARGVGAGLERGRNLLHAIFSTRTLGLFGKLAPESLSSYLSGLLIGAEMGGERKAGTVTLIGSPELCARYSEAFAIAGRHAVIGDPLAAVTGLRRIGAACGLID
jgi:2-dehydro-3-deoxygalactonokinase